MPMLPNQLRHESASKGAPPASRLRGTSFAGSTAAARKSIVNTSAPPRARATSAAAHSVRTRPSASLACNTWLERQGSDGRWSVTGRPSEENVPEGSNTDVGLADDSYSGGGSPPITYSADVFQQLAAEAERRKVRLVDLFREV